MRRFTEKRAAIEREYRKVWAEIVEERDTCCEGCGKWGVRLTPSHRIPRSRRQDLIACKENIDMLCLDCHKLVETGQYDQLQNGAAILEFIERVDPEYYYIKTLLKRAV